MGKKKMKNTSAGDGVGGVAPPSDSKVSTALPSPQERQATPSNSGKSRAADELVRHEAS